MPLAHGHVNAFMKSSVELLETYMWLCSLPKFLQPSCYEVTPWNETIIETGALVAREQ